MLEVNAVFEKLAHYVQRFQVSEFEVSPLERALGHVLAAPIKAQINVPPADNSAMDGFAINIDDLGDLPQTLPISQRIPAGQAPAALIAGSAARIFTGAEIPANANCVVMQENCSYNENQVTINEGASKHGNIRARGQDIEAGATVLKAGHKLKAQDIGLLASIGITEVTVFTQLKVGILSTGDELVQAHPNATLEPGKIFDSNQPMVSAVCASAGYKVVASEHCGDTLGESIAALKRLSEQCDVILTCGGVSVGEEDHMKAAVAALGEIDFWKVRMKPGKPLAFGRIDREANSANARPCLFIGLPGNPVSAFVTSHLFGRFALARLQGENVEYAKHFYDRAAFTTNGNNKRPEFVRVKQSEDGLVLFNNQSSGVLSSVSWADALAYIPEQTAVKSGDLLKVFPI